MDIIKRDFVYVWYYFSIQLQQIFRYWVLGMVLGSATSVFGKNKIHSAFSALGDKKLGVLGLIPASLLGIASPLCMYGTIPIAASFLTPADHAWQNEFPEHHTRDFQMEDCCGFWLDTPDGSIWAVGDSRLMEEQLHMSCPDAMLLDISDSRWHIGLEGVKKMAAAYPDTPLILWHWGSVDAPEWKEFNGNPEVVKKLVVNPERVVVLAPGESYCLKKLSK